MSASLLAKCARRGLWLAALLATTSPAVAHDTASEAANKKVVVDFYRALEDADAAGATKQRIQGIAEKYIADDYVQHAEAFANLPGPGSARDKLIRMFQTMPTMKLPPSRTLAVMAEGDLVMMLTARDMPGPVATKPTYIFNMFRVKSGRLVEHWDSPLPAPPAPPSGPGAQPGNGQ